jgi:hypothetical protein
LNNFFDKLGQVTNRRKVNGLFIKRASARNKKTTSRLDLIYSNYTAFLRPAAERTGSHPEHHLHRVAFLKLLHHGAQPAVGDGHAALMYIDISSQQSKAFPWR